MGVGYISTILNFGTRWSGNLHGQSDLLLGKEPLVRIEYKARRALEPVWTLRCRIEKISCT